ncbi:uncharacterized protein LOC130924133 isoform X5 [Corythoichthys intestinalis]|uniref:uncharacterized protein LOC130924133 isoform X5 n=1 Tax=Corythoichthys intestinalis TaxID=161448 RepID=UPI0025A67353|nr:uncharacterized protein LOC130924133 isoform X5 [Corythoichthys intestinalis]
MWCYKMPGFEALLVAELQRQQQIPQFCDTMLRAQSISVPAHSCVISAISPKLSAALSSSPTRQASYNHLVEFGTIGDSSLLHMVRLLYSGEMTGEGEHEKQEALSAAAKMGILGLVEVTPRVWQGTVGTEVGVQTDPVELREKDVACLRQEVIDSSTNLGKEMLSSCEKNIMTENEEMRVSSASSPQPVHAYNTIDMSQFQCLRQAENHNLYVPIPLVCTLDEAQNPQTSSTAGQVVTPSIAENSQNYFSSSSQAEFGVLEDEREVDEQLEQFRENIPGFINHFLNINPKEGAHGGQVKGKPRGAGGARQRKRSGTRARRPRACRGKGGWMQKVDTQEVGVSKQHKSLLHRCGNATTMRTGQGGGTTGRKLYLKTRHALDFPWTRHKGRGRPKKWDFSFSGKSHFEGQIGGDDNVKHESRRKSHLDKQNSAQLKTSSSSVHQPVSVITKLYPTRSRIKALEIAGQPLREELLPMLDQPFYRPRQRMKTQPPSEGDCKSRITEKDEARTVPKRPAQQENTADIEAKKKREDPKASLSLNSSENAASLASVGHPASEVEMGLVEHSKELANSNSEISLTMGAGSEEGVNDEDNIDVIGFAGSCQDPVPIICPVISESEQDEEEEEIDVI